MNNQENKKNKGGFKKHPYYKKRNKRRDKKKNDDKASDIEAMSAQEASEEIDGASFDTPSELIIPDSMKAELTDESAADEPALITDACPEVTVEINTPEVARCEVSGIRFKASGKVYFFDKNGFTPRDGDFVIVDTARGAEFGEVAYASRLVPETSLVLPLRPILRIATDEDKLHHEENKRKEKDAFGICLEKIQKHELDMKLVDVQYTFDNSKLLFYFTSAGRVDFRELVKDLASVFKTRIELRQIGIRDESKILGGLGACGRPLCCSTFLSDFAQVSIKMAKEQNLSLNTGKISGCCGRLMCCLQYEYPVYAEESAKTPPVESVVKTPDGIGTVVEISPLLGNVKVRLHDNPEVMPKTYHRDNVKVISRPAAQQDEK